VIRPGGDGDLGKAEAQGTVRPVFFSSDNGPTGIRKISRRSATIPQGRGMEWRVALNLMPDIGCPLSPVGQARFLRAVRAAIICFTRYDGDRRLTVGRRTSGQCRRRQLRHLICLLPGEEPLPAHPQCPTGACERRLLHARDPGEGDWKLVLPSGDHAVRDGTFTPDHIVETQGRGS